MASYVFIDKVIGKDSPTATGTVKLWPLGLTAAAKDDTLGFGEFVYVQGSTNAAGNVVYIGDNKARALAVGTNFGSAGPIGLAPAAMSGTGVYGWVQVRGLADYGSANASHAIGAAAIVGSGTLGILGATAAGSAIYANEIRGIHFVSSASASTAAATVHLMYPAIRGV